MTGRILLADGFEGAHSVGKDSRCKRSRAVEEHATSEANVKGSRPLGTTNKDTLPIEELSKKGILCHTKECGHHPEGAGVIATGWFGAEEPHEWQVRNWVSVRKKEVRAEQEVDWEIISLIRLAEVAMPGLGKWCSLWSEGIFREWLISTDSLTVKRKCQIPDSQPGREGEAATI